MRNLLFLVVLVFASCKQKETSLTAQQIIDQSILANGADLVANAQIEFDFRDNAYTAIRANGIFKLIKSFKNNNFDLISDVISNTGFRRTLNGNLIHIPDSIATEYASSVNSVHYFSVLPYGLNDKAVKKK